MTTGRINQVTAMLGRGRRRSRPPPRRDQTLSREADRPASAWFQSSQRNRVMQRTDRAVFCNPAQTRPFDFRSRFDHPFGVEILRTVRTILLLAGSDAIAPYVYPSDAACRTGGLDAKHRLGRATYLESRETDE
jgi:hypothetical protein